MEQPIADIRKNYSQKKLSEKDAKESPFRQFETWWQEALASGIEEPNAMTLATSSADGIPSARIVLLKEFSDKGFVFFTNYESYKGKQLAENPRACLVFFWKDLERQVRITGLVEKVSEAESVTYFNSRPLESRIGATVSPQSQVIESREWLEARFSDLEKNADQSLISKPAHWGGYRVIPAVVEFWQGRPGRLHDRLEYTLEDSGKWKVVRLAP